LLFDIVCFEPQLHLINATHLHGAFAVAVLVDIVAQLVVDCPLDGG